MAEFNPGPFIYEVKALAAVTLDGNSYATNEVVTMTRNLLTRVFADDMITQMDDLELHIYPESAPIVVTSADAEAFIGYVQETYNEKNEIWRDWIDYYKLAETGVNALIEEAIGTTIAPLVGGLVPEEYLPAAFSGDMERAEYATNGVTGVVDKGVQIVDIVGSNPAYTNSSLKSAIDSKEAVINLTADRVVVSVLGGGLGVASAITVAELETLDGATGILQTQIDSKIPIAQKGAASGVAPLDAQGRIPSKYLTAEAMEYLGSWDPTSGYPLNRGPALDPDTGLPYPNDIGDIWIASVDGIVPSDSKAYKQGDWTVYNGTTWERVENVARVSSVNGEVGAVDLNADDIAETASRIWFTTDEETKLAGIAAGAEVNVQADWGITGVAEDSYILNKPFDGLVEEEFAKKEPLIDYLTPSRVVVTDATGKLESSPISSSELLFLTGVNDYIQDQIDSKHNQIIIDANYAVVSVGGITGVATSVVTTTELSQLSGILTSETVQSQLDSKIPSSDIGVTGGVAPLGPDGRLPSQFLPIEVMEYQGTWNPADPLPIIGEGSLGDVYVVSAAGSKDLGAGVVDFLAGDWIVCNGTIWEKSENRSRINSVNGYTGVVILDAEDIEAVSPNRIWFTEAESTKLATLESGAEVNVQADWGVTGTTEDSYIKNKPALPVVKSTYSYGRNAALQANKEIWAGVTGDNSSANAGWKVYVTPGFTGVIKKIAFKTDNCGAASAMKVFVDLSPTTQIISSTTPTAISTNTTSGVDATIVFDFGTGVPLPNSGANIRLALSNWCNYPSATVLVEEVPV